MDRLQKVLLAALVSISIASWAASQAFQADMMSAMMMSYDALSVLLFTAVWTAGMAAMMFPALSPVLLVYNRLIKNGGDSGSELLLQRKDQPRLLYIPKTVLFVGCYLAVWVLTGLVLLVVWSALFSNLLVVEEKTVATAVYYESILLIISGAYQFSRLKSRCLGYCESPMSFFMRRWRSGTLGAVKMGTYHGLYCLGCCWPYFLLMVALGWMNVLWMALFASIIFAEKTWSKGIWVARAAGVGLAAVGIATLFGVVDLADSHEPMMGDDSTGDSSMRSTTITTTDEMAADTRMAEKKNNNILTVQTTTIMKVETQR